jgi:hypothetical protein
MGADRMSRDTPRRLSRKAEEQLLEAIRLGEQQRAEEAKRKATDDQTRS